MEELTILLVSRCKYNGDNVLTVAPHTHGYYHFIYAISGEGEITADDVVYPAVSNSVFIIRPGVCHSITSCAQNPLTTFEVKFSSESELVCSISAHPVTMMSDYSRLVTLLLEQIIDEALWKKLNCSYMMSAYFQEILALISRQQNHVKSSIETFHLDQRNSGLNSDADVLQQVIQYINDNYQQKITVQDLGAIANMSGIFLSRLFKRAFGISPIHYVNLLRLNKAKELLLYSSFNITQIAEATGFQGIHYFSRYFTEKEGMSPLEFRQNVNSNVYIFYDNNLSPELIAENFTGTLSNDNIYIIGKKKK